MCNLYKNKKLVKSKENKKMQKLQLKKKQDLKSYFCFSNSKITKIKNCVKCNSAMSSCQENHLSQNENIILQKSLCVLHITNHNALEFNVSLTNVVERMLATPYYINAYTITEPLVAE